MGASVGELSISLLLNNKHFGESIKTSLNLLKMFKTSAKDILAGVKPTFNAKDIDKEVSKFEKALKKTGDQVKKTDAATKQYNRTQDATAVKTVKLSGLLQNAGLRFDGLRAIVTTLRASFGGLIQDYKNQEVALAKLERGLQNVGATDADLERLNMQATELQRKTIFADEQITNAQAMLTTFMKSAEEIEILTPRVLDLAAAFEQTGDGQKDLQQIAVMLGKVNETTVGELKRVGVAFTKEQEAKIKSLRGTEQTIFLTEILDQNFKGLAESIGNTTTGKMAQFKNALGDVREKLGAVLVKGVLPLIQPLSNILTKIENAPPWVHKLAVAVVALGAAFLVMNTSVGKTPYILIALVGLLTALPGPLRIVASTIMIVVGAIWAYNVAMAAANVASGGLPLAIGLIVTGIAGLIGTFVTAESSIEEFNSEMEEASQKIEETEARINDLKNVQSGLQSGLVMTKETQDSYNESLNRVKDLYPQVVSGIDLKTHAETINGTLLDQLIEKEENLMKARKDSVINLQVAKLRDYANELADSQEELEELNSELDDNGKKLRDQAAQITASNNAILGYGTSADEVKDKFEEFRNETSRNLIDVAEKNDMLKSSILQVVAAAFKTKTLPEIMAQYRLETAGSEKATNGLNTALKNMTASALAGYLGIADIVGKYSLLQKNLAIALDLLNQGNLKGAQFMFDQVMNQVKILQSAVKQKNAGTDTGTKTKSGKTSTSKDKQEQDEFTKRFNNIKTQIALYEEYNGEKGISLLEGKKELETLFSLIVAEKDLTKQNEKSLTLKKEINSITDDLKKLEKERFEKSVTELAEKVNAEAVKNIITSNIDAEMLLHELRIQLMEDEFQKKIALIKKERDEQLLEIEKGNASPEKKEELSTAINQKAAKDIDESTIENFRTNLGSAVSAANQIASTLGIGAHTFVGTFLKGLQDGLSTVNSIVSLITSIASLASGGAGGFSIFSLLGFAGGGFTGHGGKNEPAGVVHKGEYVINKQNTQQLRDKFGWGFLAWLNGGGLFTTMANHYAAGGVVTSPVQTVSGTSKELIIPDVKLKGRDIWLSFRREDRIKSKRRG